MRQRLADYKVFWREFRDTFHTTGSVIPSGPSLARALASEVKPGTKPSKILEAGPGTGAVTACLVERLGPEDQLDLVELNERFVEVLQQRFETDPKWNRVANQVRILNIPLQELPGTAEYDRIVSGLPLSNFSCELVEELFQHYHRVAAPRAMLSFFEYIAVRKVKALWSSRPERLRLSGIDRIFHREFSSWEISKQCILPNVSPAWVHHLQMPGGVSQPEPELLVAAT